MGRFLITLLAALTLTACGTADPQARPAASAASAAAGAETATARLNEWFDLRYEDQLAFSPMQQTYLGRKDDYDRIDDFSEAAEERMLEWRRRTVEDLRTNFDYESLSPEGRTSWDLWEYLLEQEERAAAMRRHPYVFTQMMGPQVWLPQFLITAHRVDEPADMEAYIARIGGVARAMDQLLERARVAADEGTRPPRFAYESVREQARTLIAGAPLEDSTAEHPVWADATAKIQALQGSGQIDGAHAERLADAVAAALNQQFKPAYEALIEWLTADLPNTDDTAGVWKLPDGERFYALRLAEATTTPMTADEIHEYGLAEVARLHREMAALAQRVGFAGTLQEFFAFMREDPQFYFPDTDEGREAYLQASRDHLEFIAGRLPDYFGTLPRAPLEVKRVEPFREQPGAPQHYLRGAPDGSRPGVYYVHLADMQALPRHELEVVAYHEGNPGHHMQISIAQELTGLPNFRTQQSFTAYVEGWALYAEWLAREMGAYQDPYSEFGRLSAELWRSIRLVLDTGIHAHRWSEADAVRYFLANSATAESAVRAEVRRYIVWPGQATAYKIGMRTLMDLRDRAQDELGDAFDIRAFHDAVLGGGALPLPLLERRVADWIASRQ